MSEEIRTIAAGSRPYCDIVRSEDGLFITIRSSENHEDQFQFPSSMLGTMISMLREFERAK